MSGLGFNLLLREAGLSLSEVRLLRHETRQHGRTPFALWRDDAERFADYQRIQRRGLRAYFRGSHWASFVVTPNHRTLFVGVYDVGEAQCVPADWIDPLAGRKVAFDDYEVYTTNRSPLLSEYAGRLVIDWGAGTRGWRQLAANQDKRIVELREQFVEPSFPGYASFLTQLSDVEALPQSWQVVLAAARGIYLLASPTTREQYVGSATGAEGFLGRWLQYAADGHGGNVALRSRQSENYRVSILQVAGSADSLDAILTMEALWKDKLQSREMGLNQN